MKSAFFSFSVAAALGIVLAFVGKQLIEVFYGSPFVPAIQAFWGFCRNHLAGSRQADGRIRGRKRTCHLESLRKRCGRDRERGR